jgi:L-threonylcarbamoyladenylate synthase
MILPGSDPAAIAQAVQALRAGERVGLPTETVYGLAADADNAAAVAQIYAAKGRPSDHPLIVHVASSAQVARYAAQVADFAQRLIDAFWPGPLTLILPRRPGVAAAAGKTQSACAAPRTRWPRPCCAPAVWGWRHRAPTASAGSAQALRRMCKTNSAMP